MSELLLKCNRVCVRPLLHRLLRRRGRCKLLLDRLDSLL